MDRSSQGINPSRKRSTLLSGFASRMGRPLSNRIEVSIQHLLGDRNVSTTMRYFGD
ncbi:MAG: hypothetical protein IH848_07595 [Acidobacteria bacterium]|nr:hypothetical protein [Acidobacteriota bacterium]